MLIYKYLRTSVHAFCLLVAILALLIGSTLTAEIVRRGGIDIGSGSIKLKVVDVELSTNQIEEYIFERQLPILLKEHLIRTGDGAFDEYAINETKAALDLMRAWANSAQTDELRAVTTAAFRTATNGEEVADELSIVTGIPIKIINQETEGLLGYEAVKGIYPLWPGEKLFVWDVGGGSLQLIYELDNGEKNFYLGTDAAVTFKEQVIREIKQEDPSQVLSPNPMSPEEVATAIALAKTLAQKVPADIKEFLQDSQVVVVGIGSVHNNSIAQTLGTHEKFTTEDLEDYIAAFTDKIDADFPNPAFANMQLTNVILVYGFMKELGIEVVIPVPVNMADGVVLESSLWAE